MQTTLKTRSGYLPSLDGWRAIAILGVLAVHDLPWEVHGTSLSRFQELGSTGVLLFFAISGILITSRILEEENLTGKFHLSLFYIRRIFRIQPAALTYLSAIAILTLAGVLHEHWKYWFGGLFLYENFLYNSSPDAVLGGFFTGHFWTLAVEEHFYLIVSLALFFVRKRRAAIFAAALIAIKMAQMIGVHYTAEPLLRRTYWQIHMLLWPTLAAILLRDPGVRAWTVRWLKPGLVFIVTAVVCVVMSLHTLAHLPSILSWSFTFWVVATMLHPESWSTRGLEWAPLRFLGRISYSLYLWHVLFFSVKLQVPIHSALLTFLSGRPWKYLLAVAAALASYFLIEKPFIRMGYKLAPPASAGHADLSDIPTLATRPSKPAV
jgi:peptidoglycan/LPS O-acetylase OafA/YrhL